MTSDTEILKAISGSSPPLIDFEEQKTTPFPLKFNPEEELAADAGIQNLSWYRKQSWNVTPFLMTILSVQYYLDWRKYTVFTWWFY